MVEIATSFGRSGLQDWLIQRVSAVVIAIYTFFLTGYFLSHTTVSYIEWRQLFSDTSMQYGSFLVLLSLLAHAWIGFWTITTDYIKHLALRLILQVLFILAVLLCLAFGIQVLFSVKA